MPMGPSTLAASLLPAAAAGRAGEWGHECTDYVAGTGTNQQAW
jgi:hypothetical protein